VTDKILIKNLWECKKIFRLKTNKKFPNKNLLMNNGPLSVKFANNCFNQIHSRKQSATVVSNFTLQQLQFHDVQCEAVMKSSMHYISKL